MRLIILDLLVSAGPDSKKRGSLKKGKMMNTFSKIFILAFLCTGYVSGRIATIEELDEQALFHFSIFSDCRGAAENDPEMARAIKWIKSGSLFALGLGDNVKGNTNDPYLSLIKNDPFFSTMVYENIGDGENQVFGSGQGDWGAGRKIFSYSKNFWGRKNVLPNPYEKPDAAGNVPSYYAWFEKSGYTVHVLSLTYSDEPRDGSAFRAETKKFMLEKLDELGKKKTDHDIIIVMAHSPGHFVSDALDRNAMVAGDAEKIMRIADFVGDASMHLYHRHHVSCPWYDNAVKKYPGVFDKPNGALWINTGIVIEDGYLEFHVIPNPTRLIVQYMDTRQSERKLVTKPSSGDLDGKFTVAIRYPVIKQINGPVTQVNWNELEIPPAVPPGPPVKLTVTASPGAINSDVSTVEVTATLRDSLGQATAVGNGPVTFTVTAGGTIAGAPTVTPVKGNASVNVSHQAELPVRVTAVMGNLSGSVVISGLTNLISNNSFEIPGPAGPDDASGWTRAIGHTRSSDKSHSGSWSLKSVSNGSNTSIVVPVEPGVAYTISGYIFNNGAGSAYIDMNDIPGEVSLESQKGGSDWQKVEGAWTNTSGLTSVTLRLVTDGGNTQTWFDDISFIGPGSNIVSIKDRQAGAGREFRQGDLEISPVVSFPGMKVRFIVTKRVQLDLDILDIRGKLIKRLYSKLTEPGSHSLNFDVTDLKPGLYMLRGSTSFGSAAAKKFLVLK